MKIMASITGYAGEPTTLVALLDHATGVLAIAKTVKYRETREEGFAFVTNTRAPAYDCLFKEESLADAIRDYREADGSETVVLSEETMRYRPRIESDGVNEKGQTYRLAPDIQNGEMAVLALTYYLQRQRQIHNQAQIMDDLMDLISI